MYLLPVNKDTLHLSPGTFTYLGRNHLILNRSRFINKIEKFEIVQDSSVSITDRLERINNTFPDTKTEYNPLLTTLVNSKRSIKPVLIFFNSWE